MKSRLSILTIAIAAFMASQANARAQDYSWPGQDGYAQQAAFSQPPPMGYPPAAASGYPAPGQYGELVGDPGEGVVLDAALGDPIYPWKYWGTIEGLVWWRQGRAVPALVTTSPALTAQADAGVLGRPDTTILFGGNRVGIDPELGISALLGVWLDELKEVGIAARGFGLESDSTSFFAASDATGSPILAIPFFNVTLNEQNALLVAFPGLSAGSVTAQSSSRLHGAEIYVRVNWDRAPGYSFDLIGGYLYTRIDDLSGVAADFVDIDPTNLIIDGTRIQTSDNFNARNDFHGAQLGFTSDLQSGRFTLHMVGKAALGNMHQSVNASGDTIITVPGFLPFNSGAGLFAAGSNTFIQDEFCVVPEANITGGLQVNDFVNVSVGYNFMYWTRVAQGGEQVNTNSNPSPPFAFRNSDFWVQGLTFGVTGRF